MVINETVNNVNVVVNLNKRVNILYDLSGTGKTFLMSLISSYCTMHGLRYGRIAAEQGWYDIDVIIALSKTCDYLMLDNADLYLTNDILREIKSNGAEHIIISMKHIEYIDEDDDTSLCKVHYDGKTITVED